MSIKNVNDFGKRKVKLCVQFAIEIVHGSEYLCMISLVPS